MVISGFAGKMFLGDKELKIDSWSFNSADIVSVDKKKRRKKMTRREMAREIENLKSAKDTVQVYLDYEKQNHAKDNERRDKEVGRKRDEDIARRIDDGFHPLCANEEWGLPTYYVKRVVIHSDYAELHTHEGVVLIKHWTQIDWRKFGGKIEYGS